MIKTKIKAIVTIVSVIILCSCQNDNRTGDAVKIVKAWTGKEIIFSKLLLHSSMTGDSPHFDLYSDNCKILLYVDSLGCTSCRLNLSDWKMIMEESDTIFFRKPDFVFIFQPKKDGLTELQSILKQKGFRYPVFIDSENEMSNLNIFPSNPDYLCFLLDGNNNVLLVGNPSHNTGIWALYKKVIRNINESDTIKEKKITNSIRYSINN